MIWINHCGKIHKDESYLERPPSKVIFRLSRIHKVSEAALDSLAILLGIVFDAILIDHGPVHKAEGIKRYIVFCQKTDTFSDPAECFLALLDNMISDFSLKNRVLHLFIFDESPVYPGIIRIRKSFQPFNNLRFFCLGRHKAHREIIPVETFQRRADSCKFILRNKVGFYEISFTFNYTTPSCCTAPASTYDWPLSEIEFICAEHLTADMLGEKHHFFILRMGLYFRLKY